VLPPGKRIEKRRVCPTEPILPTMETHFHRYFFDVRYGRISDKNDVELVLFCKTYRKWTSPFVAEIPDPAANLSADIQMKGRCGG
jgi:hypothetical protein